MKAREVLNMFLEETGLDGKSKVSAKNYIYKLVDKELKGFYTDEYWTPINNIFKILQSNNIEYVIDSTKYDNEVPPKSKTWYFTIEFLDNKGKKQTLVSQLKAHGGGSVQDPLDRYDLTLIMN